MIISKYSLQIIFVKGCHQLPKRGRLKDPSLVLVISETLSTNHDCKCYDEQG
jgi:hypothetical protein